MSTLIGANGQGKTNVVEAVGYLATLGSHRVASDGPLVRHGAERAILRGAADLGRARQPGGDRDQPRPCQPGPAEPHAGVPPAPGPRRAAHRAVRPRGPVPGQGGPRAAPPVPRRPPGRPGAPVRRRSAGTTSGCCASAPRCSSRCAAGRGPASSPGPGGRACRIPPRFPGRRVPRGLRRHGATGGSAATTLDVWDEHLATKGAELLAARISLTGALRPLVAQAYTAVSGEMRDGVNCVPAGVQHQYPRSAERRR